MAEKIQFFPIDITYKTIDKKPAMLLYGRTPDKKQICVIDKNIKPYFYCIPKKGIDIKEKLKKIRVERDKGISEVIDVEEVEKKLHGKSVLANKIYTRFPQDIPIILQVIEKWDLIEGIYEHDLNFSKKYLIDKEITPLTLTQAEGSFINIRSKVPVLNASNIEPISNDTLENPKILSIDIETYNPHGKNIDFEKNPIIMLALYGNDYEKVLTWKKFKTKHDYIEFVDSEAELILRFKEIISEQKPDILSGYASDNFDLPYLEARAKKYKLKLDIGLDYSHLEINKRKTKNSKITGISHIDIFRFIKTILKNSLSTEILSLNAVAKELISESKNEINLEKPYDIWDNHIEQIEEFCEYNLNDAMLTFKLTKKIMPNIVELVKIIGLSIYDINRLGISNLIEWHLIRNSKALNEIVPRNPTPEEKKERIAQSYKGGYVYEPKPGLYANIAVFDYRSLYPTIISTHNIGPDTLNCECCVDSKNVPESENIRFCTKKKGFIPDIVEKLITRRMRIKEMMKKENSTLLETRSQTLKLLANSFYGYLGFFAARWYSIESAKSITAYGRFYIQKVIDIAKKHGFTVIYSDTDSVFLLLEDKTEAAAIQFSESMNAELPVLMELEYEGLYQSGIFVASKVSEAGAKKKYALLSSDNKLKIRGFESVRRNYSPIAKEVQENVLNIILKEKNPKKAREYVKETILKLKENKIEISKVTIHTQLQKDILSYSSIGPHVAAAKRMQKQGFDISPGCVIEYVIVKGSGMIRERARLPSEVDEYDPDYYINNQVIPAVEKIFDVLGYKKEEILGKVGQKRLEKFFG